jgi:hypothetical protein
MAARPSKIPMLELLNNVSHKDLRVVTRRGAQWGDDVMSAPVTIEEFRSLQAHYPILFQQDAQGRFHPIVLFGLQDGQNLFLDGQGWDAEYLPLAMRRMPFSIGVAQDQMRMMVDMDSRRIAKDGDGEAVFLAHGGNSEFLDQANSILRTLHEGLQVTAEFMQVLASHRLLEPFVFEVEQPDGSRGQLAGLHLIHEERLAALDASTVARLHEADYLQPIYMAVASLSNLSELARRHRSRQGGGAAKA